ncbi:MAG: hypothetical protein EBR34_16515, partial [Sphingomonadaceae bacterium]|nr:hypothetical protein [Sphingomonadaceae bacterium]
TVGVGHSNALTGEGVAYSAGTVTPSSSSTVALSGVSATYATGTLTGAAPSGIDPFAGDEYRKRVKKLAEIADQRRRATAEEAGEVRREIQAILQAAQGVDTEPVQEALAEAEDALPADLTVRGVRQVEDWTTIVGALLRLETALLAVPAFDDDEEDLEVLLLL